MAEALAVIGVVASILQLVDYGSKLVSYGTEIVHSAHGTLKETGELRIYVQDIKNRTQQVKTSTHFSQKELGVQDFADESEVLADDLIQKLDRLKVPEGASFRRLRAARASVRALASKNDLRELETRLHRLDEKLKSYLLEVLLQLVVRSHEI